MTRVQRLNFFFKIFICNMLLQLFSTSRIITAATSLVPFCFQGHKFGTILFSRYHFVFGFTSTKVFFECCFIRSTHPEVFFNEIWNIYRKVFLYNSCSEYFREIPRKKSATELIFNIIMSFQYALCRKWFPRNFPNFFFFKEHSSRDASDFVWLFLENVQNTF